jgi:glyoxylase I family protein
MKTTGIHHFAIKVRNLAASERFYCGVLGLTVIKRWPAATGHGERSVWLDTGDPAQTFLALEVVADVNDDGNDDSHENAIHDVPAGTMVPESAGHHLVALRILPDQRATYETRLTAAGVAISHRTAYTIYFTDPEGNRLGLSHHPDPPSDPAPDSLKQS